MRPELLFYLSWVLTSSGVFSLSGGTETELGDLVALLIDLWFAPEDHASAWRAPLLRGTEAAPSTPGRSLLVIVLGGL
jgi:hypothetical protein